MGVLLGLAAIMMVASTIGGSFYLWRLLVIWGTGQQSDRTNYIRRKAVLFYSLFAFGYMFIIAGTSL